MVDTRVYRIVGSHYVTVRIDLHRRRHDIVVDEGKESAFCFRVSLVQGKGILEFLERIGGYVPSERYVVPVVRKDVPVVSPVKKRGRKKKLKGKVCEKCQSRMTKLYMHSGVQELRQWIPVVWYCSVCDKLKERIR